MKTSLFDFDLPPERIAQYPVSPRDAARMLVVGDTFIDSTIRALPDFLKAGDIVVFNDTKVIPARLLGKRSKARVEVLLHKALYSLMGKSVLTEISWQAFAKPAKRLRLNDSIIFAHDFFATVSAKGEMGEITLRFDYSWPLFLEKLHRYGHTPLPPYMKREDGILDRTDYQTVYAKCEGAIAAPTAGLHFTDELFAALEERGIQKAFVTLHVGAGTFLPVKVEDTDNHIMHTELGMVTQELADAINRARASGGRVVAIGTTSLRLLESAGDKDGIINPFHAETDIFITPGYKFRSVDMLLTNFHLPKSTLFMLVCAFSGMDKMKQAYAHAIDRNYRFYSYGDACLLYKTDL